MTAWLAIIIGAVVGVVFGQMQKVNGVQGLAIAGVAGAIAGLLGFWVLGWLGVFVGQVAVVGVAGALAVYGLQQAKVIK